MDFTTYYCGPYWSEGKFQASVEGTFIPDDPLDYQCYVHDRAYARGEDLEVADNNFHDNVIGLGPRGFVYGKAVKYGNRAIRGMFGYISLLAPLASNLYNGFRLTSQKEPSRPPVKALRGSDRNAVAPSSDPTPPPGNSPEVPPIFQPELGNAQTARVAWGPVVEDKLQEAQTTNVEAISDPVAMAETPFGVSPNWGHVVRGAASLAQRVRAEADSREGYHVRKTKPYRPLKKKNNFNKILNKNKISPDNKKLKNASKEKNCSEHRRS